MPRQPKALVLDSWSVIAYLEDEPAGKTVAELIADAHQSGASVLMTLVNAGEVWYIVARGFSHVEADRTIAVLENLKVRFVPADWKLTRAAATLKAAHPLSYADCFAAALAQVEKAELVTGDPEFRQVEGEVKIRWL